MIDQMAPAFELPDTARDPVTLDDLKGRKSLIVFIPFPFSGICTEEVCTLRDNLGALADLDANVVVISCDTHHSNRAWREMHDLGFPVLSDFWPHGAVSQAFGVFNDAVGCANRATFVLDAGGIVREVVASDSLGTAREYDLYVEALQRID